MTASRDGRQKDEEKQVNNDSTKFHLLLRECGSEREEVWARCGRDVCLRGVVECPELREKAPQAWLKNNV